ncbi:uncharacterized protein [Garra rufa]|uniref:uncharacterized protein n=1 Tax=Garra rufa TaxID=137080 RepID=UPI003CCEB9D3
MGHHTVVTRAKHEVYMKSTLKLCPFCHYTNSISHMVHVHVRRHFETAVRYKDFFIVKCSNQCREKAHFHCCFCENTVINKSQLMTHILSHHEPCVEPGVTSDMHIENVMNKDTVGLSIQHECSSVAQRFGAESCIRESPALKVERFCDTAKRQDPTSTTSASSNKGAAVNPQSYNTVDPAACSQIRHHLKSTHHSVTSHKPFWAVEDMLPDKAVWGQQLPEHLQKMILNCCLRIIEHIAFCRDISVYVANSYVVATWLPPLSCFPELSLPANVSQTDLVVLPAWVPGHWLLCEHCKTH